MQQRHKGQCSLNKAGCCIKRSQNKFCKQERKQTRYGGSCKGRQPLGSSPGLQFQVWCPPAQCLPQRRRERGEKRGEGRGHVNPPYWHLAKEYGKVDVATSMIRLQMAVAVSLYMLFPRPTAFGGTYCCVEYSGTDQN